MVKFKTPSVGRPVSTRDFKKLAIRLPNDLHAKLKASAVKDRSNVNSEIAKRLLASFETA